MAQWINLNWNYKSVVAHRYSALRKNWACAPTAIVGLTAGWQADAKL